VLEAEYAFNTQKRIVAVRLEAGYKPDGWLGPLTRNNLFYDFSAPEKFNDEWSKLHAKLTELKQPGSNNYDGAWEGETRRMCPTLFPGKFPSYKKLRVFG